MPLHEIRSYDVRGNAAEGFEINDERPRGQVYIRPSIELEFQFQDRRRRVHQYERDVVQALVDQGALGPAALDGLEAGMLHLNYDGGSIEVTETVQEVREQAGDDDDDLAEGEPEVVEGQFPLLGLRSPYLAPGGPPFWRTKRTVTTPEHWAPGGQQIRGPETHDLEILVSLDSHKDPRHVRFTVTASSASDREVVSDVVELGLADWGRDQKFSGFDPITGEELRLDAADLPRLCVSMDWFLETGKSPLEG